MAITWFSPPAVLNTDAGSDHDGDYSPQVTTDGAGNWVAVWLSDEVFDTDIHVSRSTNDCVTWTAPEALNTNAGTDSALDIEPQVTTDGAGNWVAVWWSEGPNYVLVSRSTDAGGTWTAPEVLNTAAGLNSGSPHNDRRGG